MKSYLKIFMPLGLAIFIGLLTTVFAQTKIETNGVFPKADRPEFGRMPPGPGRGALNRRVLEQLNLTDEQKTKIAALENAARESSQIYFEKLRVVMEKLNDTTEGESFDEAQARALLKERSDIETEIGIIHLKTDFAVRALLTAEQIAKLDLLKAERPEPPRDGFRPPLPPQP